MQQIFEDDTELVDEVMIKAANAKIKKIKVVSKCPNRHICSF